MGFWSKWFHKKNKEAEENSDLNSEETSNQEEKVSDGSNADRTQYEKDVQSIAEEQETAKSDVEPQESEEEGQKVN